ncbi:hypothetical protein D3C77_611370 [compost metagenome]
MTGIEIGTMTFSIVDRTEYSIYNLPSANLHGYINSSKKSAIGLRENKTVRKRELFELLSRYTNRCQPRGAIHHINVMK